MMNISSRKLFKVVVSNPLFKHFYLHLIFTLGLRTTDITAHAGEDYEVSDIEVVFHPQETTASATIPLIDDFDQESVESFRVALSDPSEGAVGPLSEAVVTISDDDGEGVCLSCKLDW